MANANDVVSVQRESGPPPGDHLDHKDNRVAGSSGCRILNQRGVGNSRSRRIDIGSKRRCRRRHLRKDLFSGTGRWSAEIVSGTGWAPNYCHGGRGCCVRDQYGARRFCHHPMHHPSRCYCRSAVGRTAGRRKVAIDEPVQPMVPIGVSSIARKCYPRVQRVASTEAFE